MDSRYQLYIKKHLDTILNKLAKHHYPSYKMHFYYVWESLVSKRVYALRIYIHPDDHKHFVLSDDILEQIATALKEYEGHKEIFTAIENISFSEGQITVSFNYQSLLKNIS